MNQVFHGHTFMKVELLPSTLGDPAARQFSIAVLVNDTIAIDAGTIGLLWPMHRQMAIQNVFLSHSHVDHLATLPLFLDNVYVPGSSCPSVYASVHTEKCLREDIFNDRLWPDFIRLSAEESPFLQLHSLTSEVAVELPNLRVTPVDLNHVVPTLGFVVEETQCAVAFISDTRPTRRIWELLTTIPHLKAVFLECSFPNSFRWLADKSGHLCPLLFQHQLTQIADEVPVFAYHLKPGFYEEIARELKNIPRRHLEIGTPGQAYHF